jgi:L-fuconate dehydratase
VRITDLVALDVRFPTSRTLAGSDAMNPDPDYSAAYAIVSTDDVDGRAGHGLTFTIGRGTEVCVRAIEALRPHVVGWDTSELFADMGGFWRRLTGDSQLRWIGPEKGAMHMATAAVVNAVWDLWGKVEGKPLWKLLADLSPAELVGLVDFTYLTDAITPAAATARLESLASTRGDREAELRRDGYPAYVTSVGWMGYEDAKIVRLAEDALADGWTAFKMKVGRHPK